MKHGTQHGYQKGCRDNCPATPSCREVNRAYHRDYQKRARETASEQDVATIAAPVVGYGHLARGRHVEFVAWERHRNGDRALVIEGTYQGSTPTHWQILVDGEPRHLDRERWNPCLA